ncbi:MAG: HEPN domain-containing protein [Vulcanimicrobiota bacterium]
MSPENREFNLSQEWKASTEEFEAGEQLAALGFHRQAVGRFYYAAYHAAKAALLARGLEPATHSGLISEFHRVYVHNGDLDPSRARLLNKLQRDREEAEYRPAVLFTPDDVTNAREAAVDLRDYLGQLLADEGWLSL